MCAGESLLRRRAQAGRRAAVSACVERLFLLLVIFLTRRLNHLQEDAKKKEAAEASGEAKPEGEAATEAAKAEGEASSSSAAEDKAAEAPAEAEVKELLAGGCRALAPCCAVLGVERCLCCRGAQELRLPAWLLIRQLWSLPRTCRLHAHATAPLPTTNPRRTTAEATAAVDKEDAAAEDASSSEAAKVKSLEKAQVAAAKRAGGEAVGTSSVMKSQKDVTLAADLDIRDRCAALRHAALCCAALCRCMGVTCVPGAVTWNPASDPACMQADGYCTNHCAAC